MISATTEAAHITCKMIVFPDIHGRTFWRQAASDFVGKEHLVFLGDYLDPYSNEGIGSEEAFAGLQDIVRLKEEHPDEITLLLGNHDLHYLYDGMSGSRFDYFHAERNQRFFEENGQLFQMAYEAGIGGKKYLFSHAGILPGWLDAHKSLFGQIEPDGLVDHLNSIWFNDKVKHCLLEALSDVSYVRWGSSRYGSMVWADVSEHDSVHEEIPGYYQVFGHTKMHEPDITPYFACLDCRKPFRISEKAIEELPLPI